MSEELMKIEQFKIATLGAQGFKDLVQANLGGGELNPWDMDTVKFPSARSTKWPVPDVKDESGYTDVAELQGVIVHYNDARRFWRGTYGDEAASAPDCVSHDTRTGEGDPGGDCDTCEYGVWDGKRPPECKIARDMMLILPNKMLPVNLSIGPGSYTNIKKYFIQLISEGIPYWKVITSLTLKTAESGGGIAFPKASAHMVEEVQDEGIQAVIDSYRNLITKATPQE